MNGRWFNFETLLVDSYSLDIIQTVSLKHNKWMEYTNEQFKHKNVIVKQIVYKKGLLQSASMESLKKTLLGHGHDIVIITSK